MDKDEFRSGAWLAVKVLIVMLLMSAERTAFIYQNF